MELKDKINLLKKIARRYKKIARRCKKTAIEEAEDSKYAEAKADQYQTRAEELDFAIEILENDATAHFVADMNAGNNE